MTAETPKDPRILTPEEIDALLSAVGKERHVPDLPVDVPVSPAEDKPEQGDLRAAWEKIFTRAERGSSAPADLSMPEQTVVSRVDDKRMEIDPLLEAALKDDKTMSDGLNTIYDSLIDLESQHDFDDLVAEYKFVVIQFDNIPFPSDSNYQQAVTRVYALYQALDRKFKNRKSEMVPVQPAVEVAPAPVAAETPVVATAGAIAAATAAETAPRTETPTVAPEIEVEIPAEIKPLDKQLIDGFAKFNITAENLDSVEGFAKLTPEQQEFLLENFKQIMLGMAQEQGRVEYKQSVAQSNVLGKVWKNLFKQYYVAKTETAGAKKVLTAGFEAHHQTLADLVRQTAAVEVIKGNKGHLEVGYLSAWEGIDEDGQKALTNFNKSTNELSRLPYEWSLPTADKKQQQQYQQAKNAYEAAKNALVNNESFKAGYDDKWGVMALTQVENNLRLRQFLNTNPEAEQELQKINSDKLWQSALVSAVQERGGYFAAGFVARTATVHALGVIGAPLAASVMGGWLGRKRAKEGLKEADVAARRGSHQEGLKEAERKNYVDAESLTAKLHHLIIELDAVDFSGGTTSRAQKLLNSLRARLEYTKDKLDKGLVNFGSAKSRLINQQELIDALNLGETKVSPGITTIKERLNRLLQRREEKISQARKSYLNKQMVKGALFGAVFASAGYAVRSFLFHEDISPDVVKMQRTVAQLDQEAGQLTEVERFLSEIPLGAGKTRLISFHDLNKKIYDFNPVDSTVTPRAGQPIALEEFLKTAELDREPFMALADSSGNSQTPDRQPTGADQLDAVSGDGRKGIEQSVATTEPTRVTGEDGQTIILTEQIKAQLKTGDSVVDYGEVAKNKSVSEALGQAMAEDAKVTVINPDGNVLKGADGQPVKFDANLVHEGDKVFEVQRADGSKKIWVQKAGVTVKEGMGLDQRYKDISDQFKLDEISDEVKNKFNTDKGKGVWHDRLNYQEAKAAREYWDAHPAEHTGETIKAAGGVTVVPGAEPSVPAAEAPRFIQVDKSDVLAGLDVTMENGDEMHFYDSADDADEIPNGLAVKTQDGAVFYQVSLPENLTHEKAEELIAQAKLAAGNLTEFSKHLGETVERAEAAKFYAVYDKADNVESLAKYQAGDYGQLDEFLRGLKNKDLSLLKIDGLYSEGKFAITSELLKNGWKSSDISKCLSRINNGDRLDIAMIFQERIENLPPEQMFRGLDLVEAGEKLNLSRGHKLTIAFIAAQAETDFGAEKSSHFAGNILGSNFEALSSEYNRAEHQAHFKGLIDLRQGRQSARYDVTFDLAQGKIIIAGVAEQPDLTDDNLNRMSEYLRENPVAQAETGPIEPVAAETPAETAPSSDQAKPNAPTEIAVTPEISPSPDAQNIVIRQAVEAQVGRIAKEINPDEELVYSDYDNDGIIDVVGLAVKGNSPYFTASLPKPEDLDKPEMLELADAVRQASGRLNTLTDLLNKAGTKADREQAADFLSVFVKLAQSNPNITDQNLARAFEATAYTDHLSLEKDIVIAALAANREALPGLSPEQLATTADLLFGQSIDAQEVHFKMGSSETLIFEGKTVKGKPVFVVTLELKNNQFSILDQKGNAAHSGQLTDAELNNIPYYLKGETLPDQTPPDQTGSAQAPEQSSQIPPATETEPPTEPPIKETVPPTEPPDKQTPERKIGLTLPKDFKIADRLENEVGKPYSIGRAGYDCMTLVRQAARENKGEYPVLDDYDQFLSDHAGKPDELKFSVFLREQPLKFENASWDEVKQTIEPGEYLINMESGGGPTYGPEGHGAILTVTSDRQFIMHHASTAALMPENGQEPVPMHELILEVEGHKYQGRQIVEEFKAAYKNHITDRQADGSKLYDQWLAEHVKFIDKQGHQVRPKLEPDGSLRLGYVTKETDLDSYFRYNQDFARNIDVLPLKKEAPVLAKAA